MGGRGDGDEGQAAGRARPACLPARSRGAKHHREAAERLCRRRRCWRRLLLTAALFSSPRPRRGGRARARACDPSAAPRLEGSREGRGRLRRGRGGIPLWDNHGRHVRPGAVGSLGAAAGGPRRGVLLRRVRLPRDGVVCDASSLRGPVVMRLSSASGGWGCGILSLDVGLPSCPGDGMWSVYSCLWWEWQWQGRPRSSRASSMGPSSRSPPPFGGLGSREGASRQPEI